MADQQDPKKKEIRESGKGKGKATASDASSSSKSGEVLDQSQLVNMLRSLQASGQTSEKNMDMDKYKFWKTQPVQNFDESKKQIPPEEEGPIKEVEVDKVKKTAPPLPTGYEWCTIDLNNDEEVKEVYDLLANHYVEDFEAKFRFNYSQAFFNWALKAPGWSKEYHIGVRIASNKKLMATIFGIPLELRVRQKNIRVGDINYLCVHKKLRDKRLAPVLISEVTRKFNLNGIFQGLYTAGIVLPSPLATCRYFHRTLNFEKLYAVGFSPLPQGMEVKRWARRFILPDKTQVPGLRKMQEKDLDQVGPLLKKYLDRFDMAQIFNKEELRHWFLHPENNKSKEDQVIWSYVVEKEGKITDFFSFYNLESSVIRDNPGKHKAVRAAYSYYYATDAAFQDNEEKLKKRLNELMKDALVIAKQEEFDVFNALSLMDNRFYMEQQKFGVGDGLLHYYLYNYRAAPISGGLSADKRLDPRIHAGVGLIML